MCGITGWYNWKNAARADEAGKTLRSMLDVITHRGPDEEGAYLSDGKNSSNVALGIRRLSIIDLKTGAQPIHNEDKTVWVVCNGEIYNFGELRQGLEKQGHRFYTNSDVEVLVHLYEEKRYDLLRELRGMYAFALWDAKENKLFAARDRVGKKPLVYTVKDGALLFASEIKSLLEYPGVRREVNLDAIDLYLTYQYVPAPFTAFKGIHKLPPAHYLTCDSRGNIRTERYWDMDFTKKLTLQENEWEERILDKLREATKIRMVSDVPLGAFLSGGIDSSAVVAMMARESPRPVKTFAIGFEEQDFSELKYARLAAKHIGTDHHEFIVRPHTVDLLPKIAWHYGEPFSDSSALPSYYVAQQTRRQVTVALNGDGGDENFAGYLRYRAFRISETLAPVNHLVAFAALPVSQAMLRLTRGKARRFFHRAHLVASALEESPARRNIRWHCIFDNKRKAALLSDEMTSHFKNTDRYDYLETLFNGATCA
ncbi:MAG: asparagine synthase (glutamine-hydrolyzing), partial [Endomicrobiales bacterium]